MFTIRRPRLKFLAPLQSTNFLLSPKKNKKKVATIFRFFLLASRAPGAFWRHLELFVPPNNFSPPPEAFWRHLELFVPPNNFSPPPNVNLADVWYIFAAPSHGAPGDAIESKQLSLSNCIHI